jgi:hypothetical protein
MFIKAFNQGWRGWPARVPGLKTPGTVSGQRCRQERALGGTEKLNWMIRS